MTRSDKPRQRIRQGIILVSFFLFPAIFYYLSPVVIVRAAYNGIVNGSLIVFALLYVAALFAGRAYCGWVCPAAGCQEALFAARSRRVTRGDWIKWAIWVPWIGSIVWLVLRRGGYSGVDFFYETTYGLSIGDAGGLVVYLLVLFVLIVIPALAVGRRSFCHHLCWMAPFMILGRRTADLARIPALRLAADPARCVRCHTCTRHCPMSLDVEQMVSDGWMENHECILCGSCVDGCDKGVIEYVYRRPPAAPAVPNQAPTGTAGSHE